ncbi:MAG TPA: tetratricopeptide repeat protein, partial [Acidobacteriaceae bacterium]|nr:tetratricopeptide repeat protein [Acidobacteriaceae bacterium]
MATSLSAQTASPMTAQSPAQTQPSQTVDSLLGEGYKLYDAGKYAEAAQDFEAALKSNPNDDQVIAQLGYAYLNLHENDKARAEFEIVAKGADAKLRAEAIAQLQDMQAAESSTGSGAGQETEQKAGLAAEGYNLYDAGKYAEAAKDFEQVLQADPKNYEAAAQLGYAYLNLHDAKRADTAFHIAAQSTGAKLRAQALAELKLLHPPTVYLDVYGDLIYLNRFDDFVGDLQTRLAKSFGSNSPFSVYWGNTLSRDSGSQNGQFPIIFADNV